VIGTYKRAYGKRRTRVPFLTSGMRSFLTLFRGASVAGLLYPPQLSVRWHQDKATDRVLVGSLEQQFESRLQALDVRKYLPYASSTVIRMVSLIPGDHSGTAVTQLKGNTVLRMSFLQIVIQAPTRRPRSPPPLTREIILLARRLAESARTASRTAL